jgi:radical SAM superfamily enzyme YgiQ (UPF0313 family)
LKEILLITPPFTQLNTPYPATAYLKGFLNTKNIFAFQVDLGIEVILEIFSKQGLIDLFNKAKKVGLSENAIRILALQKDYIRTVDQVMLFLMGKNPTLAKQICSGNFLPQASRFKQESDLDWAFGFMGSQDKAKHLATLYLEDLSDFIVEAVDANFGFSRYAEKLGRSANTFDELHQNLSASETYIDKISLRFLKEHIEKVKPKLVCFSVPFPGNLYSAFRCAKFLKANYPEVKTAMGGGFANTELRQVNDKRVFEYFDFITLDDGELPVELLYKSLANTHEVKEYKRTFIFEKQEVKYVNSTILKDYPQSKVGTPDYSDLHLDKYISIIELVNPMHSLWSDGRWNKLTMAHGCYWGKCTFCDISLDYIKLYEPVAAKTIVDRMQELILQTGENGFHFVDEAAPPALMKEVALEILRRELIVTWWTNIRFEKSFTSDLCVLLKASGCIAVSGGLEVASDRLLALIDKGVTVAQVAKVNRNFIEAGIMVHAYLMYGFPSQTVQETIDSLEMVRQMFEIGVLNSAFWHQFALTAHSPVGKNPELFGIIPDYKNIGFADNDIDFKDKTGIDHQEFSYGLKKSLYNYMHGLCFDFPLQKWFDFKIPKTTVKPNFIAQCLEEANDPDIKPHTKLVWVGSLPEIIENETQEAVLIFHEKLSSFEINLEKQRAKWLYKILAQIKADTQQNNTYNQIQKSYALEFEDFHEFWGSEPIQTLQEEGLIYV